MYPKNLISRIVAKVRAGRWTAIRGLEVYDRVTRRLV